MEWNYYQPVRIRFGNKSVQYLPEEVQKLPGQKGLLITSPSFVKRGLAGQIAAQPENNICAVYSQVSPNPDVTECAACVAMIKAYHCDFVVALGGGSVLDCAKAAATICMAELPVTAFMENPSLLPQEHLPFIAIPTTAGTGSEVSCVSVLSDHEKGTKKPLSCAGFYPTVAIVDPELTYTVPPYITACTGMDVFCHALEAYWSKKHQPICDALAVHALNLVLSYLRVAYQQPTHAIAREKMAEASVIAGLSFTMPKTNSAHACSYPLTSIWGIPHGEACALTIDTFLEINGRGDDGRIIQLAKMLGFSAVEDFIAEVRSLKKDIGLRCNLQEFALDDNQIEQLVQCSKHPNLANNPVEITEAMLRDMYFSLCK